MIELHLGVQGHVIAGLGYAPTEAGITKFNDDLNSLMSRLDYGSAERVSMGSVRMLRNTIGYAFGVERGPIGCVSSDVEATVDEYPGGEHDYYGEGTFGGASYSELSVVDARSVSNDMATSMMSPVFLDRVESEVSRLPSVPEKHAKLQSLLLEFVYLPHSSGLHHDDPHVSYAIQQAVMCRWQRDPVVVECAGRGMKKVMDSAGIKMGNV